MSRIGKLPIKIPENVEITWKESTINVRGKFGTLNKAIPEIIEIKQSNGNLIINRKNNNRTTRALHGLYRTLINNMVLGVSEQFQLTLLLKGVGYRATIKDKALILNLGYSHPVKIEVPTEISAEVIKNTSIKLKACDKEILGLFASNVRFWRQPEPYKGKGIFYEGETIILKAGKSAKK